MNILQIHISDGSNGGGGGIAMRRLNNALRQSGVEADILCRKGDFDLPHVHQLPRPGKVDHALRRVTKPLGLNDIHLLSSFSVKHTELHRNADVLDFHGIHSRTLSYLSLPYLTSGKPALFTLHDIWALTGHCTISYECQRWQTGCGRCPHLDVEPAVERDATRIEWLLKKWTYANANLAFVVPSYHVMEMARQSIISEHPLYLIPNGVDTNVFHPMDQEACRRQLGIPAGKRVLFTAAHRLNRHRKGVDLLVKALRAMPAGLRAETVLLTMGHGGAGLAEEAGMEAVNLGYLNDEASKAVAYAAADLFLFPTRAETFGLVSIESQACGTPVVSFRVGGVPDHVRPGETGLLAEPEDAEGFAQGVVQLLEDDALRTQMRQRCREMVVQEYSFHLLLQRYIRVYRHLAYQDEMRTTDSGIVRAASSNQEAVYAN